MIAMRKWLAFHMQLVFSVDTWKNQVRSMEMGVDDCDGNVQVFHMQLVLSMDTWKNQVKSMEMGTSVS